MASINNMTPDTSLALMQATQDVPKKSAANGAIDAAAQDFEAMFVTEMIKPMFETVGVDENFGGGKGEEVFRDFLTDEYGKMIAKTGGVGLAPAVKEALLQAQAAQNNTSANATTTNNTKTDTQE